MRAELHDPQAVILSEIADKKFKRNAVALTYAFCIRQSGDVDWPTINRAILDRWSQAGLEYIKREAWKWASPQRTNGETGE